MQKVIKFSVVLIFTFIIGVFFVSLSKNSSYDTKNLIGKKIPEVNLKYFGEDKFFKTNDLKKSNFTLINFWASWCGPCRIEHPILMKLASENNLNLLGVNFKDKEEQANTFLNKLGNPYDYLTQDDLGVQSINFGIYGIPESILVDRKLTVIKKFVGPLSKEDFDRIKEILNNL